MPASSQVRLLLVEDVPQVAQYIRGLLNAQQAIKLLDVLSDGSKVLAAVNELRPDVVIVDVLLQGRVKGPQLVQQLAEKASSVPVIVLTVPQQPVLRDPDRGIDEVLPMPFSGFELVNKVQAVHKNGRESQVVSRLITVFAPKGGVGKTTIAFNLAVALGQLGSSTVLIDGSLQFGDLRALLKVPVDAPSILDLPTDRVTEPDLRDVLWRDPSGIDILLAPPRIEQAEMISARDLEKIVSLLRRVYASLVVDSKSSLDDGTMYFLDASDVILEIVTHDSTTIYSTMALADLFRSIGYPPTKVRYIVNRADSPGGIGADDLARALGRQPEHRVVSDGRLVVECNNAGVPFVLANPEAPITADIRRIAETLVTTGRPLARAHR